MSMRLDVKAFAITSAILWGAAIFLVTWWMMLFQGATGEATIIGKLYPGYSVSALGSVIGLLWAVPDGAIMGALFALLYNRLLSKPAQS
jgi:hypothetical protein